MQHHLCQQPSLNAQDKKKLSDLLLLAIEKKTSIKKNKDILQYMNSHRSINVHNLHYWEITLHFNHKSSAMIINDNHPVSLHDYWSNVLCNDAVWWIPHHYITFFFSDLFFFLPFWVTAPQNVCVQPCRGGKTWHW